MFARFATGQLIVAPSGTRSVVAPARLVPSATRNLGAQLPMPFSRQFEQAIAPAARGQVLARGQANSSLRLPLDLDLEQPLAGFDSIASALEDLAAGKLIVVLDDEDRENEGDLIMNADKVTTETMAFLVEHTSGVACIAMEGADLDRLRLPLMVTSSENEESMYTAFTITVDLRDGISTGISAEDRAKTIRRLADPAATSGDFRRPGHIFPLRYRPGGVLVRPGHTEAAVDLARLSGSFPAGVLCELVNKEDGSMSRTPQLLAFAKRHGLRCVTIADLIRYRLRHEALVAPAAQPVQLPAPADAAAFSGNSSGSGCLTAHCFRSAIDGTEHLAFVHRAVAGPAESDVLLYVHQERTVADLINCAEPPGASGSTTRAPSLDTALRAVAQADAGVVLYLRGQTARGLGLSAELAALGGANGSGNGGAGLYSWDLKDAAVAAHMLRALDIRSVALAGAGPGSGGEADAAAMATALRSCGLAVRQVMAAVPSAATAQHNGNMVGHVREGQQKPLQAAGLR